MKKLVLINLILLTCLTFGFGQTKVVLDSSFYYYGTSSNPLELQKSNHIEYDEKGRKIKEIELFFTSKYRYSYQYFDVENIIIKTTESWSATKNDWELRYKFFQQFDGYGNTVFEERFRWDEISGTFESTDIITTTYNKRRRPTQRIYNDRFKSDWTYNDAGMLLTQKSSYWEEDLNQWSEERITDIRTYDANGNLLSFLQQTFVEFVYHYTYSYDNQNRRIEEIRYTVNKINNDTLSSEKTTNFYNGDFRQPYKKIFQRDFDVDWELPYQQILYTYNTDYNVIEELTQNAIAGVWTNQSLKSYTYLSSSVLEKTETLPWDNNNNQWEVEPFEVRTYQYENDLLFEENLQQKNSISLEYEYRKWNYFYNKKMITEPNSENLTCLFPNPYVNFQNIYCDELAMDKTYDFMVFNLMGQAIYQTQFMGRDGFRVEKNLDRGWYVFVVLEDGKIVGKQKILVF